jgi:hypothetical protein
MSLRLVKAVLKTEEMDDFHLGRILLLLQAKDHKSSKTIEGITKLAKYDFLLRYPNCLERALKAANKRTDKAAIKSHERTTIETKMIRFRYGPWDKRYRRWIGLLVARGLATTFIQGRTVHVGLTEKGRQVAAVLSETEEFYDIKERSSLIVSAFGSYSASKIKNFIYDVFPEIETMNWGEEISI